MCTQQAFHRESGRVQERRYTEIPLRALRLPAIALRGGFMCLPRRGEKDKSVPALAITALDYWSPRLTRTSATSRSCLLKMMLL